MLLCTKISALQWVHLENLALLDSPESSAFRVQLALPVWLEILVHRDLQGHAVILAPLATTVDQGQLDSPVPKAAEVLRV